MKIVIIGSGKVATWMGKTFMKNDHEIIQVYSQQKDHAEKLATALNCESTVELEKIKSNADLCLIAVTDNAIEKIVAQFPKTNGIVIHTSGSADISFLNKISSQFGVMWPMISVTNDMDEINDFTMIIEASDAPTELKIKEIASLFTQNIVLLNYTQRQILHLSAVFANNFTNHLIAISQTLLEENNINSTLLQPLIQNMLEKLQKQPAKDLQSGPALRNDTITMQNHLQLLKDKPELAEIYKMLSVSIAKLNQSL